MRPFLLIVTLALLASTLAVPGTTAHAAAPPPAHETRILHDHNDDSLVVLLGKHGFDAIALDAREAYDLEADEPTLVLKLVLNGGCSDMGQTACEDLRHVISFNAAGTTKSVSFVTTDGGTTWTGDMDRYGSPVDLNDGGRFSIAGEIRFSALGITTGDGLSDWYVEGFADGEAADNMPAGFDNQRSDLDLTGPIATVYDIGTYTVRAPDYYVTLETDDSEILGEASRNATVTNLLDQPASIFLSSKGPDGIEVAFDEDRVDLEAGASRTIGYTVSGHGSGDLRILASTGLGGIAETTLPVVGGPAGPERITSPDLESGGVFERLFDRAGVFSYHNHKNPLVEGTVTVMEGNGTAQTHEVRYIAGGEHGESFDPAELTIHVGDTVRWVNDVEALAIMGVLDDAPTSHDHHHHHHHEEEPEVEDAPAAPLALLVVGLIVLALRRR